MNNKSFNFGSKEVALGLFIILILFIFAIVKAFDYIPQQDNNYADIETRNYTENTYSGENSEESADESSIQAEEKNKKSLNIKLETPSDFQEEIQEIDVPPAANVTPAETINKTNIAGNISAEEEIELELIRANKLKEEKQYVKAIEQYNLISEKTTDMNTKARCYEAMASLYGISKRYGTALSYAQKAYNIMPTSSREVLIARLYYKTGDIDKATKRINNVLQRDFSYDR